MRRSLRLLFALGTIIFWYVLLEGGAFVAWGVLYNEPFSFAALRSGQRIVNGDLGSSGPPEAAAREPLSDRETNPRRYLWTRTQALHPYLGFVRNPGEPSLPFEPPEVVSDYGFVDTAPPLHRKDPDKVIIAITGGSVAKRFSLEGVHHLEEHLGADSRFADRSITWVRLALGGYKQPQQLQTMAYLLALGAEFDVLINIDGFNEVALHGAENAHQGVFPAYPRGWAVWADGLPDAESQILAGEVAYRRALRRQWAATMGASPWDMSILAGLVWRIRDAGFVEELARLEQSLLTRPAAERSYVASGPQVDYPEADAVYEDLVATWRRSSIQLQRLMRANGIAYYHFLQPNQYVLRSKPMGEAERARAFGLFHPFRRGVLRGYPLLVRDGFRLRRAGVKFHDLTRLFSDTAEPIYTDRCCHVNELGNELLADAIAGALLGDRRLLRGP